jgi:hypothetical protein
LLDKRATKGTINSGFTALRTSSLITPLVIPVAAIGAIAFILMSFLPASLASVLVNPTRPFLAAE